MYKGLIDYDKGHHLFRFLFIELLKAFYIQVTVLVGNEEGRVVQLQGYIVVSIYKPGPWEGNDQDLAFHILS